MHVMRSTMPRNRREGVLPDPTSSFGPLVFDPSLPTDRVALDALRASGCVARTTDLLARQLEELGGIRGRTRGASGTRRSAKPGCWVFFPWSAHLVRTLDRERWTELRSDRNRYKLTTAEQRRLAATTVAVAGLSVGASVVHVMALEGTGGLLRLADPDTLDGSNYNRVRASMWDLGQPKAVLAARMVWEIDPFRHVEPIPEGVSPANVARFLDGADVVVEECDSFAMKVLLRREARRRRLPVVMATAEGGMLDVERFDLEPTRPLFHGLAPEIESTDLSAVAGEDRVRLALQIVGVDHVSDRSAASMIEIDRTVSTWPQLAGEVVSGGAHAAVAVRRILLGQPCPSGRYHVDIDRVLGTAPTAAGGCSVAPLHPPRPPVRRPSPISGPQAETFVEEVVAAATRAPSAGNSQPWRFEWDGHRLSVWLDRRRAEVAIDPRGAFGWIAVGAACENIAIVANHRRRSAHFSWFPDRADRDLAAMVTFSRTPGAPPADDSRLFPLIAERCTDRTVGASRPLSPAQRQALKGAASVHGASLYLIDDRYQLARFATMIGTSDRVRFLNPTLHRDVADELRWSTLAEPGPSDGIDVATLGLEPTAMAVLRLLVRPGVSRFLAEHGLGCRLRELQRRAVEAATALGLVTVSGATPLHRVHGGRALQRVWLEATARGLAVQPVTPLSLFDLLDDDEGCLSPRERHSLRRIADDLAALFGIGDATPILVVRLHHGSSAVPVRAGRRPIREVLATVREAA
jgi:molybdopterin/thiamine biosynthesis adenylyltransferase